MAGANEKYDRQARQQELDNMEVSDETFLLANCKGLYVGVC